MKSLRLAELQGLANNTSETPISASGGEVYDINDGAVMYRVHVFRTSSEFTVSSAGSIGEVEYLIVAGGGGGGGVIGGGGGAGGFLAGTATVTAQTYSVIIGAGGLGGFSWNSTAQAGVSGTDSSAIGLTAIGGGGGGAHGGNDTRTAGFVGGSAGGSGNTATVEQGIQGQGNAGGGGGTNNGGGGGGAGSTGLDGINAVIGGRGGHGRPSDITGAVTWYAGGGGGGTRSGNGAGGLGGRGGAGNGGTTDTSKTSTDGVANTGGGGGAGGHNGSTNGATRSGANGGSGIIVIRYPIESIEPIQATGGTITNVYENGVTYRVHDFSDQGSGNFVVTNPGTDGRIEYLLVGGGGGGGGRHGGGGGGGGLLSGTMLVTAGTYPVVVGSGGTGALTDIAGASGTDSFINIPGHQSVYFDNVGDYLTVPSNALFNFGAANFTMEAWVQCLNPAEDAVKKIMVNYNSFTTGSIFFGKHGNSPMDGRVTVFIHSYSNSTPLLYDPTMLTSDWTHYAVVREGNTWTMYRNGNVVSTASWAGTPISANSIWNIGGSGEGTQFTWNGFISNVRVVKGRALYTGEFSPPAGPLGVVDDISLLACRSDSLEDLSGNGLTVTAVNNAIISNYSPFNTAAIGGGGGGSYGGTGYPPGKIGGSGGGGGHAPSVGAAGIPGQGYAGGNGLSNEGAGGGGAGGVGENGSTFGGRGGHGRPVNFLDAEYFFSGGGGGGGWETAGGAGGSGGGGGGGAGAVGVGLGGAGGTGGINPGQAGVSGTTGAVSGGAGGQFTGGGGGGSGQRDHQTYTGVGGNGGSGVALIRYPLSLPKIIKTTRKSSLYVPGSIVQCVYVRSDLRTFYTGQITGDGTTIDTLGITIKPRRSNSMLLMKWMINGEVHQDVVFLVHRNGRLIYDGGYEAFNSEVGNLKWSGIVAGPYESNTTDYSTTPNNFMLRYWVPAINTDMRTYAPAIRGSSTSAFNLHLNRVQATATGTNAQEMTISTGVIMEIAQ